MNFWKTFGASLLALVVASTMVVVGVISLIFSILFTVNLETEGVQSESVLFINIADNITDAPPASVLGSINPTAMTLSTPITIIQALTAIENAAVDSCIEGICIYCNGMGTISSANIEELRSALINFKNSGKFVVAYDDTYTQSEYYLATAADKILINPEGSLDWRGMNFSTLFYKGLMDKLNLKADIFRPTDCKFKSAVEPYFRTNMSKENRLQMEVLVNSMWNDIVNEVAVSRNLDANKLKRYAANLEINSPEDALSRGMVDRIAYEDELYDLFSEYGVKLNEFKLHNQISLGDYVASISMSPKRVSVGSTIEYADKPLVAIIYADGQIVDGNMYEDGYVFGSRLADELRQARLDDDTKAVVVRVNSPGGSALASEIAWREMTLLQQTKPVVISMGEMAASGGYYISAPADYIYADKFTLTGSIGVFAVIYNLEDMLKNKLGVTIDSASTAPSAGGISILTALTPEQRKSISNSVDNIYTTFTSHVAEGRNLSIDKVLEIAEGRVWSGSDAVKIGLVDEIGGFTQAIAKATQLAGLTEGYTLYEFNAPLTPFEMWLESMSATATINMGIERDNFLFEDISNFLFDNPLLITNGGIQAIIPGEPSLEF
jgi:protease-4